ncbi:cation:proton antiporter [Sulfitobacter sp. JBTF-M27]|uniref:Cation:proton antiporter n=1 Tax=Sulfitobacter sediminilitoris TaxID=2698830 RepID=A0A6P0CBN7_9RHOB|nr:cation:proton antiporter [Sulfitobacter sediminilitoris]NEK23619.1 cation:proton antiporter [Sulfitobacter sediminilitoris]
MIYSDTLLALGILFFAGLLADQIGRRTRVPRVTLLLMCGLIAGWLGLLPERIEALTDTIMVAALTFVSFLLGGSLKADSLKSHGVEILLISVAIVLSTLSVVTLGLLLLKVDLALALVLASIATATAPAATLDVIRQSGIDNGFVRSVKGIVAIDDVWGLIAFSLCLSIATHLNGTENAVPLSATYEIGGAIFLGLVIGLPAAFLTGRIDDGEPLEVEALGIAFLTAGLALWMEVSFLIAGMVVGALIANVASHHNRAFHEIEHIQWPFMILFFILAGASLNLPSIAALGGIGIAFVLLRTVSRLAGGWIGASLAKSTERNKPLFGIALLPQAGVAIGMALLAGQALPAWKDQIMILTVGSTVVFELIGPFCTMWAIRLSVSQSQPSHSSCTTAHKEPPQDAPEK